MFTTTRSQFVHAVFSFLPQFECGQSIHLEPDIWRYCEQSSGATFTWIIYQGKAEIARFETPTLLLRPQDLVFFQAFDKRTTTNTAESTSRGTFPNKTSTAHATAQNSDYGTSISATDRDYVKEQWYRRALVSRLGVNFSSLPEGVSRRTPSSASFLTSSELPVGSSLSTSGIGTYMATFTVTEEDTVVHSGKNISFQVVEVPFS